MPLTNPRLLVDDSPTALYTMGRRGHLAVDVADFAGGDVEFVLYQLRHRGTSLWREAGRWVVPTDAVGSTPATVKLPLRLNYPWRTLGFSTRYDVLRSSWSTGNPVVYDMQLPLLEAGVTDEMVTPPLHFTVKAPGQAIVSSPELFRDVNSFAPGNMVELFIDGDDVLPALLASIGSAQRNITVNWFFFSPDEIGQKVIDALVARAAAGVDIRLLFAHQMTEVPASLGGQGVGPTRVRQAVAQMEAAGIEVGDTNDLLEPSRVADATYRERLMETEGYYTASFENLVGSGMAAVDHSKYLVIDGEIGFIGGMNCGVPYLFEVPFDPTLDSKDEAEARRLAGLPEAFEKWHDLFVRFHGPAASQLQAHFIERWAVVTGQYLSPADPELFPVTTSVPAPAAIASVKVIANVPGLERDITFEHLLRFWEADAKIMVSTPYLTDDLLAFALADAASQRGVDVTLIVPDEHLDFNIVRQFMRARYEAWRAAGIKLYEYENRMTHVKIAVIDSRYTIVGSYNFGKGSAAHLFETNIVVDDPSFAADVESRVFGVDLARSTRITGPVEVDLVPGSDIVEPYL